MYIIDAKTYNNKKEFHLGMKNIFDLDEYYGENLDALWDMLNEFDDIEIKILNSKFFEKNLGEYGIDILNLFKDIRGNGISVYID